MLSARFLHIRSFQQIQQYSKLLPCLICSVTQKESALLHHPLVLYQKTPQRKYSSVSSGDPIKVKLLSDVEEIVGSDFTMSDLELKIKEETQPAVATTLSLLDNCKSEEEILVVIKNAAISEKLWPDELPLYFEALCRMRSKFKMAKFMQRNEQPTDRIIFSEIKLQEYSSYVLLKDPYFQHLLLKTLQQSPLYLTKELVHLFRHFTHIQISPDSNAMSYLIHVMQNRINDFFPVDVVHCFYTLRYIGENRTKMMENLNDGLFLHLENLLTDEISFSQMLVNSSLTTQLRLLKHVGKRGSIPLRNCIMACCTDTIKLRPNHNLNSVNELHRLLQALMATKFRHKYLLKVASTYARDNKEFFSPALKTLIGNAIDRLNIDDGIIVRRLRRAIEE